MGKTSTFLHDRIAALLKVNAKGDKQFGARDQYKALREKHGEQAAQSWLREHIRVTLWARAQFELTNWGMADTETTDVDDNAEVIEFSLVRCDGEVLFDSLLGTKRQISSGATNVHKITQGDVATLPSFAERRDEIQAAVSKLNMVMFYNGDFDLRVLAQTAFAQGCDDIEFKSLFDPMQMCANWVGDWNARRSGFRWPKLEGGHRGKGDCLEAIRALKLIATSNVPYCQAILSGEEAV